MSGYPDQDPEIGEPLPSTSASQPTGKKPGFWRGFVDPVRRPRFYIWTGVALLALAAFMILALGATSSYWFCANVCHKVQDDTIIAYNRSSHDKISCMACHEPVNADPVTFILAKAEALGELYLTATSKYELPLNPDSKVSEEMPSSQCTQCHALKNRTVTPGYGIIIDHTAHEKHGISCTTCHNRVAHPENFGLTLKNPNGKPSRKHRDDMKMQACFRCHSQEPGGKAPGACKYCHPAGFPLKPVSHDEAGFYTKYGDSSGHWKLYNQDPTYCKTCHSRKFCTDCHGIEMPHPKDFAKNHGKIGKADPGICANCHAKGKGTAQGTEFCNACHHKAGNPEKPWLPQHPAVVAQTGATPCFDCHDPVFCARCHVRGGKLK